MNLKRALIAIALAAVAALSLTGCSSASYKAKVTAYNEINPADLDVTVKVTNTGSKAGAPYCTVSAQDGSGAYHGFNAGTLSSSVAPGTTETFVLPITITSQGAQYVTQATASCR